MKKNWNEWEMWANNIIYHTVGQLIILLVARLAGMSPPQRMAIWFVPHLPAWNFPLKKFGSWYSPPPPPTWTSLVWILIAELATSSFSEPFCPAPKPGKRLRRMTKRSSYTTIMFSTAYAADLQENYFLLPAFVQYSAVFYNMTKLTEWIVFAGLAFSIWITLLTDILPLKVSYKAKEVIWPVRSEDVCKNCTPWRNTVRNYASAFI